MIGTIRKHSKVLWWIVIVVVIITFVVWGSQRSNRNGGRGEGNYGVMNGQIITPMLFEDAAREVKLKYFYSNGAWPGQGRTMPGFEMDREVFQRLLLIQKAEEMDIHVSDDVVARAVSAQMRALNRGNPVPVAEFEKQFLNPARLNFADFERFIRNELGIQLLASVAGAGGELVTPQEIEALYRRDFQEVSVQAVFFHATNHFNTSVVTPEKLGEFYTNRQAYYRLPDRMQINYVRFPLSNFLAQAQQELDQVTNLNELVEASLLELGTNYPGEAKTPEEAKKYLIQTEREKRAFQAAAKEARKFDNQLYDSLTKDQSSYKPEAFVALAKEQGLTAHLTEPFSAKEPPTGLGVNAEFVRRAFNLTPEEPLTEPLAGEKDVYVIAYHRQLPSENPPYETIRERVTQDYRFVEAAMSARQAGFNFHASVTNGLGAGKSFAMVCAAAGVKSVALTPFSQSTRTLPEVENVLNPQEFKQAVFATAPGQVAPLLASNDGAVLVFVQARLPVDEAAMRTNLPAFTRSVHQVRHGEVFNEWFQREADKAFSTVPYFQQRRAQMTGTPAQ